MDTHFSTGDIIVAVFGLVILAITAIGYQIAKRRMARYKATRAAALHAAE